jgi:hypothetical protein
VDSLVCSPVIFEPNSESQSHFEMDISMLTSSLTQFSHSRYKSTIMHPNVDAHYARIVKGLA